MTARSVFTRRHLAAAVFLLAFLMSGSASAQSALPDIVAKVRPSIVAIGAVYPRRQPNRKSDPVLYGGTGFVVGDGHHVITNHHVLPKKLDTAGKQKLAIFSGRGEYSRVHLARVVRVDQARDLALLQFDGKPLPALTLGTSGSVREGQEIAFTGYPIGAVLGLYPATHRGIVAAVTPIARPMENARHITHQQIRRMRNPYNVFQLDAVAYPGNSGSPVFDVQSGKVLGVINAVLVKQSRETAISQPSGISYAIPVEFVKQLLEKR